jgi:cyclopropane fatty-acyl-phospholipid synthase-like methyltransferase
MLQENYRYNEDYPYLKGLIKDGSKFSYNLRVALREYVRVYFPLKLKPKDRLLDVGSCVGTLGHYLKYGGVQTYGLDLNGSAILAGKELFGNETKNSSVVADGGKIPFPSGVFDAVVSQDVFEHLNDSSHAQLALLEMTRVLKPTKNLMFHKITVLEDIDHIHADESHRLKWTSQEWVNFFESNGWDVIDNPTRHFPVASKISYGNFLLQRKV